MQFGRDFVVGALLVATLVGSARADAVEDAAQKHLDKGIAAYTAEDFVTAKTEFASASALLPDKANPFRWLALAEIQLGECDGARADSDSFRARAPAGDARVPELERAAAACQPKLVPPPVVHETPPPVIVTPPPPPPRPRAHHSVLSSPWFWIVTGGIVATAAGVGIYAATRGDDPETMLPQFPTITCNQNACTSVGQ